MCTGSTTQIMKPQHNEWCGCHVWHGDFSSQRDLEVNLCVTCWPDLTGGASDCCARSRTCERLTLLHEPGAIILQTSAHYEIYFCAFFAQMNFVDNIFFSLTVYVLYLPRC